MSQISPQHGTAPAPTVKSLVEGGHFTLSPGVVARSGATSDAIRALRPSDTEISTLAAAARTVADLGKSGREATLRIPVGDLRLQPNDRDYGPDTVPDTYRQSLDTFGIRNVEVVGQSRYRTAGTKRIAKALKRMLAQAPDEAELYGQAGLCLLRDTGGEGHGLFIAADPLLGHLGRYGAAIRVTHENGQPTCATTLAGSMADAAVRGFGHYDFFYDIADDAQIHRKLFEAVVLAALAVPGVPMTVVLRLYSDGHPLPEERFDLAAIAAPGRLSSAADLYRETRRRMAAFDPDWLTGESLILPLSDVKSGR
ncbi:hypothetical protein [Asticcacaulis solisilvae]|uniref:hypothetical protein n=1 Tax=Asticcacaulis solisilvae TaxID=1217274 RepID=UPI003FD7368A